MARTTTTEIVKLIQTVLTEHDTYWNDKKTELKKYRDVYENKFWNQKKIDDNMIRVETADCFSYVEGFIASLFSRNPAVVFSKDPAMTEGNPEMAQIITNRFLFDRREQLEVGSRLSLIYFNSFFKGAHRDSEDLLERADIRAIPCWEVIVDRDAYSWDTQRFVGHVYFLSIPEAKAKFGAKKFQAIPKEDYFAAEGEKYRGKLSDLPEDYLYIKVVEFYDLAYDMLYFWTPNWKNGEELLEKGQIPLRTYDDNPLCPIAPLYYSRKPEQPMIGLSAVGRVYDQFNEKNILRTYWANAVRRDSRQFLYKEGAFDDEQIAKITAGIDGAGIAVDEQSLDGLIRFVDVQPVSSNFERYQQQIENDINRGSILAPFARGEATKATATEITALAQYSASEIGKMARERDAAIERIALIYIRMVALLAEENEVATIEIDGRPKVVTATDLDAKFKIVALDQSSTPLSESIKKNNLVQLLPILTQLGVPLPKIKEEIIRLYDLPESFLEEIVQETPPTPTTATTAPEEQQGDIGAAGELPAEQLAAMLGGGQ